MDVLPSQTSAILWAQWRVLWNRLPRSRGAAFFFTALLSLVWYGAVLAGAAALAIALPEIRSTDTLRRALRIGLFLGFMYWQVIPVVLVTSGMSLDLKRLLVYPIPPRQLFGIEVLLRITTGIEVLVLLAGAMIGLARSPLAAWWAPLTLLLYAVFNMFLSVGVRDLLTRLMERKGIREILAIVFVLATAAPQLIFRGGTPKRLEGAVAWVPATISPWGLTAEIASGRGAIAHWLGMAGWLAAAAAFGFWQFQKSLNTDLSELRAKERESPADSWQGLSWSDRFFQFPSRLFTDPLGALMEKELRVLARSSRFRLVFLMGFTFGLVIWLPLIFDKGRRPGFFTDNFLVMVSLYAALLLGEVLFWNSFGFDRSAAQAYYVMPVNLSTVFVAKNLTALFFLFLEVAAVTAACLLLQFRVTPMKVVEAFAVTVVLGVLLLAIGNMSSTRYPRAMNPVEAWRRSSNTKVGFLLLLVYPTLMLPIGLAYLARYAFSSQTAFFVVIGIDFLLALAFFSVALDSAVQTAQSRREEFLTALAEGGNPLS